MSNPLHIDKDAFSSGQLGSKLWLCEELEKLKWKSNLTHIYGGWHGITAFLLLSREKFKVDKIQSYDIDPACESIADIINEYWVWQGWKFKAYTRDCNQIFLDNSDLVINTSTEHFDELTWWHNIPSGTRVILQGNDMPHTDHCVHTSSLEEFQKSYPFTKTMYSGCRKFIYPTWQFTRFMLIGIK